MFLSSFLSELQSHWTGVFKCIKLNSLQGHYPGSSLYLDGIHFFPLCTISSFSSLRMWLKCHFSRSFQPSDLKYKISPVILYFKAIVVSSIEYLRIFFILFYLTLFYQYSLLEINTMSA